MSSPLVLNFLRAVHLHQKITVSITYHPTLLSYNATQSQLPESGRKSNSVLILGPSWNFFSLSSEPLHTVVSLAGTFY